MVSPECNAQMQTRRHARKVLGSVPALCWTDHAIVARLQTAIDMDPRHLRWVTDIQADGSALMNLSGTTARLGDGLNRNPLTDEIRRQGQSIKGFLLENFLADLEDGGMKPQAMPSQCLPARLMAWETYRDYPPLEFKKGKGFATGGIY